MNLTDSGLERGFLKHVHDGEYRLPSDAQRMFDQCRTRPDFIYDEQRTVVYIDGPHHQYPERAERDARQTEDLEDLGWTVVRIDDDDSPLIQRSGILQKRGATGGGHFGQQVDESSRFNSQSKDESDADTFSWPIR